MVPTVRLLKLSDVGDNVTAATPVPLKLTVCGLFDALSVIVTVPVAAPVAAGENVTEIEHFLPAATELPQVVVSEKLPLTVMLVIVSVAVPVFVRVRPRVAEVVPTTTLPKPKEAGESVTVCAIAEPTIYRVAASRAKRRIPRCMGLFRIRMAKTPGWNPRLGPK